MDNKQNSRLLGLADGFVISEKVITASLEKATEILTSDKQAEYTSVCRVKEDLFHFTQHKFFCNYCQERVLAYDHFFKNYTPERKLTPTDAWIWFDSEFCEGDETEEVSLYKPLGEDGELVCPRCGNKMSAYKGDYTEVFFKSSEGIVSILVAYDKNNNVIKNDSIGTYVDTGDPILGTFFKTRDEYSYNTLNFDLKSGDVFMIFNVGNTVLRLNADECDVKSMSLFQMIDKYSLLRYALKKGMEQYWNKRGYKEFPYKASELDSARLIALTKFIGYKKSFYERVSVLINDGNLPKTMTTEAGRRLRFRGKVTRVYESVGLPEDEAIKKLIFESPEFLLYYDKILRIYEKVGREKLCSYISEGNKLFKILAEYDLMDKQIEEKFLSLMSRGEKIRPKSRLDKGLRTLINNKLDSFMLEVLENLNAPE